MFAARTADILFAYAFINCGHLLQFQLAGENYDVGKLSVEPQCFDVRDIELGGEVYLLLNLLAVLQHSHIAGYDGGDGSFLGRIADRAHQGQVFTIDDGVDREVTLYSGLIAFGGNVA